MGGLGGGQKNIFSIKGNEKNDDNVRKIEV